MEELKSFYTPFLDFFLFLGLFLLEFSELFSDDCFSVTFGEPFFFFFFSLSSDFEEWLDLPSESMSHLYLILM